MFVPKIDQNCCQKKNKAVKMKVLQAVLYANYAYKLCIQVFERNKPRQEMLTVGPKIYNRPDTYPRQQ